MDSTEKSTIAALQEHYRDIEVNTRPASPILSSKCHQSPRGSSKTSPRHHQQPHVVAAPEITDDEYFRLLKKTDVLAHLVRVNDDLVSKEALLETAQQQNTKLDSMHKQLVVELEMHKSKYYEAQWFFLQHIEHLTNTCLQEEARQMGHPEVNTY